MLTSLTCSASVYGGSGTNAPFVIQPQTLQENPVPGKRKVKLKGCRARVGTITTVRRHCTSWKRSSRWFWCSEEECPRHHTCFVWKLRVSPSGLGRKMSASRCTILAESRAMGSYRQRRSAFLLISVFQTCGSSHWRWRKKQVNSCCHGTITYSFTGRLNKHLNYRVNRP